LHDCRTGDATRTDRSWSLIGRITAPILKKVFSELLTIIDPRRIGLRHGRLVPVDEKPLFGRSSRADANNCHSKSDGQSRSTVLHNRLHSPRRCDGGTV